MGRILSGIDTTVLDNIIIGRVEPHIYAFSTGTVPNYLKVGDTSRSVRVRLKEWRKIFPDLRKIYQHSAQINDNTIFRDHAVHSFLEQDKGRERLMPDTFENLPYYSREFFKDATAEDVEAAITDIIQSARYNSGRYTLYSADRLPQTFTYARTEDYPPRDNQRQAIDSFKAAVEAGRSNLLLYAVMRFGKSFTSMCCAKEINARFVVIVSAKADVKEEWKKTVQSHRYFEAYEYLDSEVLKQNDSVIADTLAIPDKKVALFLTLQDLQGKDIKEKHREVFSRQIDLLIIDETHFGARGDSYGKVLQEQRLTRFQIDTELKGLDGFETLDRVEEAVKSLEAKIRLHLSGTPYRILMSDEFRKEDIIAFVQFTDIIDAQQQWNDTHLKEDDCDEWENPYFGFPQMIRFAFNPNESSRKKMEQMRREGISYAFSELLRPRSMTPDTDGQHRSFKHEPEILDLLEVIDGSKDDDTLLGFLDYDKIKNGKMCRHIVCVLPFRASCDAMASLIARNKSRFSNLCDYELINIAGFDDERKYKSTDSVKRAIKEFERRNKKTLTLTVNRMLTGTTVPQWDTMLYLKGTSSPQEYDQAIFRLQNQYITEFKDENGKRIRYNMKPQTLLVDFDPDRMFVLQELKSQFYNVNTEIQGNSNLKERIDKELRVSPIIVLNKNKLQQATPANITDAVREYSRTRSILDDASEIPADNNLLRDSELAAVLQKIEPIDARNGLQIKPDEGVGNDLEVPGPDEYFNPENDTDRDDNLPSPADRPEPMENERLEKRLAAYYARILFFAFLTESTVKSLQDVICFIPESENNIRIAGNLGLDIGILNLIQRRSNPFVLRKFDYKIENTNDLMRDPRLTPVKRVEIAMRKFGRMSDSEVITPVNLANDMVKLLPDRVFSSGPVLDIASKQGEFMVALYKRFGNEALNNVYSICTSTIAYEFTRKVYKLLSAPVNHIFHTFTSYDLIQRGPDNNYTIPRELTKMKISAIIGNPPYQEIDGGGGSSAKPIYDKFVEIAKTINPDYISMIMPSRWMTGGKGLDDFRASMLKDHSIRVMHDYLNASDCFTNVAIEGGICYFLIDSRNEGLCRFYSHTSNGISSVERYLDDNGFDVIIRDAGALSILIKVTNKTKKYFSEKVLPRNPFNTSNKVAGISIEPVDNGLKLFGRFDGGRGLRYLPSSYKPAKGTGMIKSWKVFISKADGAAGQLGNPIPARIIGQGVVGDPDTICSETFLAVAPFSSKSEAENVTIYCRTKFFRFMVGIRKLKNMTRDTYKFVPMQDFTKKSDIDWSKPVDKIDRQLYSKYGLTDTEIGFIESMIKTM